jgi:hypothetical protein
MCGWHEQICLLCEPLVAAMRVDALGQPYLCIDATGVLVQAKDKCRTGHFWVIVAPKRHVLFEFTRSHDSDAVDVVLAGYEGYLVADAHVDVRRTAIQAVVSSSHASGDARAHAQTGGSGGKPRWRKILRMVLRSMTHASSCILPPHLGHDRSSWPNARRIRSAHCLRLCWGGLATA